MNCFVSFLQDFFHLKYQIVHIDVYLFSRAYAARGVYRRMVSVPTNVEGKICHYRDATKPLIQSDMDKLWGVKVEDNHLKGISCYCFII